MANKYFSDVTPLKLKGGQGGSNKAQGSGSGSKGRDGTANWPGLPGGVQKKDRSGDVKKSGYSGKFYVKSEGL